MLITATRHLIDESLDKNTVALSPAGGCPAHGLRIIPTSPEEIQPPPSCVRSAHLASIVDDAEISFVLQLLGLLELGVGALLLYHLLHEALVSGFGEPALLIQQGEDARGTCLEEA